MSKEVSNAEQSKRDAVDSETPRVVEKAHRGVKKKVENEKPGPTVEHVTQAPDSNPADRRSRKRFRAT